MTITKSFSIICMFPAFHYESNLYSQTILKKYKYIQKDKDLKSNIYLIGSFIKEEDYHFIKKKLKDKIKILWLSEPIIHHFKYPYQLIQENEFTIIYGCVQNKPFMYRYKLPLYINYYKAYQEENYYNKEFFENINIKNKIKEMDELKKKDFCCLICRHDNWNTRIQMYQELIQIDKVTCPSLFQNNYSHETFEKIGKLEFLKKYIFHLCPENSEGNFPGYITEKLMDCCLAGNIPIYYGKLDAIDQKIFNLKRILFYIPSNKESMDKIIQKIKLMIYKPEELFDFYNQDIFLPEAHEQFQFMIHQFKDKIENL